MRVAWVPVVIGYACTRAIETARHGHSLKEVSRPRGDCRSRGGVGEPAPGPRPEWSRGSAAAYAACGASRTIGRDHPRQCAYCRVCGERATAEAAFVFWLHGHRVTFALLKRSDDRTWPVRTCKTREHVCCTDIAGANDWDPRGISRGEGNLDCRIGGDEQRRKIWDQQRFADVPFCAVGPSLIEVEKGDVELLKLNWCTVRPSEHEPQVDHVGVP